MRQLIIRYPAPFPPLPPQMPDRAEALATRAIERSGMFSALGVKARYWKDEQDQSKGPVKKEDRLGQCVTISTEDVDGSEYERVLVSDVDANTLLTNQGTQYTVEWDSTETIAIDVDPESGEIIYAQLPEPVLANGKKVGRII